MASVLARTLHSCCAVTIGKKHWAIAEGYIPGDSTGPEPEMTSHETLCLLNAGSHDTRVELWIYFSDRAPQGPYARVVAAQRTLHLRLNELEDPPIPRNTDFASVIASEQPIVVQHSRLDSRQPPHALLSTVGYAEGT